MWFFEFHFSAFIKDCFTAVPLVREIFGTIIRTKRMLKFINQKCSKKPAKTPEFLSVYSQILLQLITTHTLKNSKQKFLTAIAVTPEVKLKKLYKD